MNCLKGQYHEEIGAGFFQWEASKSSNLGPLYGVIILKCFLKRHDVYPFCFSNCGEPGIPVLTPIYSLASDGSHWEAGFYASHNHH